MSAPLTATKKDAWSGLRHTVTTGLAGGLLVGINALDPTLLHLSPIAQAVVVAGIAGVGRWLQRFLTKVPDGP